MLPSMGMMRQSNQMIPTPGLNNQQSMSINSESSSLNGFSRMDSSMVSPQKTKQYVGNQTNNMLHGQGVGVGMRSNIQQKPSPYGFSNGVINGATGTLIGNNMQLVNGPTAPEGYLCPVPYEISPKSLQQNLDKQQHQTFISSDCSFYTDLPFFKIMLCFLSCVTFFFCFSGLHLCFFIYNFHCLLFIFVNLFLNFLIIQPQCRSKCYLL